MDPCLESDLEKTQDLRTGLLLVWYFGGNMWHTWEDLMVLELGNSWGLYLARDGVEG